MKAATIGLIILLLVGCVSPTNSDRADRMNDWPFSAADREAMREDDLSLVASETPLLRLWVFPSFDRTKVITLIGAADGMQGIVKVSWGKGGSGLRGVAQKRSFNITEPEVAQIEATLQMMGARTGKVPEEYFNPDGSMWLDGTLLVFEFAGPQGYHRFYRHAGDIDTLPGLRALASSIMKAAGYSPNPADW